MLAADVVYDNHLTDAFLDCAAQLLRPHPGARPPAPATPAAAGCSPACMRLLGAARLARCKRVRALCAHSAGGWTRPPQPAEAAQAAGSGRPARAGAAAVRGAARLLHARGPGARRACLRLPVRARWGPPPARRCSGARRGWVSARRRRSRGGRGRAGRLGTHSGRVWVSAVTACKRRCCMRARRARRERRWC